MLISRVRQPSVKPTATATVDGEESMGDRRIVDVLERREPERARGLSRFRPLEQAGAGVPVVKLHRHQAPGRPRSSSPKTIRNAPSGRAEIGPKKNRFHALNGFMDAPPSARRTGIVRAFEFEEESWDRRPPCRAAASP